MQFLAGAFDLNRLRQVKLVLIINGLIFGIDYFNYELFFDLAATAGLVCLSAP